GTSNTGPSPAVRSVRPPGYTSRSVPECSICRRQFDDRFTVFVPPHPEPFDSIECARKAAEIWGVDAAALTPVVLPAVDVVPAAPAVRSAAGTQRKKGLAALAALALVPGQAALAGGVGLAAAGTAASIYLSVKPSAHFSKTEAAAPAVRRPAPAVTPKPPSSTAPARSPAVSSRPAVRPPDATARRLVITHRARPAVHATVVTARPSTTAASTSDGAQFVSRAVPTGGSGSSTPVPQPRSTPATHAASTPVAKPKPKPKPTPKP